LQEPDKFIRFLESGSSTDTQSPESVWKIHMVTTLRQELQGFIEATRAGDEELRALLAGRSE
jgi:hypothetical protein